ncbi:MAG: protein TolR [Candidatus Adiutricales bacterium]|jgi:biopolymer transport protein TolR
MALNSNNSNHGLMSEINVTPLVDVMLVLLIIFMVTAPMMLQGLDVNLPQVDSTAIRSKGERVVISITSKGEIFIDDYKVPFEDLGLKVARILEVQKVNEVALRADKSIPYGQVVRIMAEVRKAGVTNLGLVTEPELVKPPKK